MGSGWFYLFKLVKVKNSNRILNTSQINNKAARFIFWETEVKKFSTLQSQSKYWKSFWEINIELCHLLIFEDVICKVLLSHKGDGECSVAHLSYRKSSPLLVLAPPPPFIPVKNEKFNSYSGSIYYNLLHFLTIVCVHICRTSSGFS